MSVFQDLYDSEINFHVSSFWDGGFEVRLGDPINGFRAETTVPHFGMIAGWLIEAAIECYPKSAFALMYRDGKSKWDARQTMQKRADRAAHPEVRP